MTININQFKQLPIRGELDLQIQTDGVFSAQISQNEAGTPKAGDPVKLDPANTGSFPQLLLAAAGDVIIGYLAFDVKRSAYTKGDVVQVAFDGGPVMYMTANAAIVPGVRVQQNANGNVETFAAGSQRGIALDPASASGVLLRIIIKPAVS